MSTWICGCDPEAKWSCDNPNCDYRRHMSRDAQFGKEFNTPDAGLAVAKAVDHTISGPGSDEMVEACALVNGPRQNAYGTPKQNYEGIARVWSGILFPILKRDITADEAALMMVGLKLQRQAMKHKRDNLVDAHGYLLVYAHIRNDGQ